MWVSMRATDRVQFGEWEYGPSGRCKCMDESNLRLDCKGVAASGCECSNAGNCICGIKPHMYAGEFALIQEGHPRLSLVRQFRPSDGLDATPDQLLKDPRYKYVTTNKPKPGVIPFGTAQIPGTIQVAAPA